MSTVSKGPRNYPLVYATEPFIKLAVAYNPFDLTDITKAELVYDQDKTLADYLEGLPTEAGWTVAYEGTPVAPEDWATTKVSAFSHIVIVRTPHGGRGGGKTALRVVALIAVAAFAAWAGPAIAAGIGMTTTTAAGATVLTTAGTMAAAASSAAITMAGGMLVNALLPATGGKGEREESATYGMDGPKNTAKEGGVVPIGYGEYRVAGNIVDFFTRNVGRDQYVFMRTVLNQGEIESIEDIEINGQPLSTYSNIQIRKRLGLATEQPNDWFDEATRMINQTVHLSTEWQTRTTTSEVDRLRVDVMFPSGLYSIDQDDGSTKDTREVTLEMEYIACDQQGNETGSWAALPILAERPTVTTGAGQLTAVGATTAVMNVAPTGGPNGYSLEGFYRPVGTTTWISAGTQDGAGEINFENGMFNPTLSMPLVEYAFHFPEPGQYETKIEGGVLDVESGGYSNGSESIQTSLTIRDKTTKTKRLTYEGALLDRGYYKLRFRRTTAEKLANGKEVDYVYDEVYVTDIGEIDTVPVNLNGIANLSICIKADEQLTGVPTLTALCKLSKVKVYDDDGTVIATQWSDNPADVVADILHNQTRGAGYAASKTVWSKYVEFREHCIAEGLKFNGIFDTANTLWDAIQAVAKVGHGTVVPRGTKFSFAIDKASDPVALFTPSSMFKDTFKKDWMSITDRANEIQLKFADKESAFAEATVRLADSAAFSRGARQKIANVAGFGITNIEQATAEAEYYARQNSYIRSFVTFDAPLEAIGLTIGDVALIQHDSVDFNGGVGGRLKAGSSSTVISLDRPVTMTNGKEYTLLVFQSALQRDTVTITNILGSRVTVTGLPNVDPVDLPRVLRIRQGSVDREIVDVRKTGSTWTLIIDGAEDLSTGSATLWDIDVIEERTVTTTAGEFEFVTVTEALSQPPEEYANYLFGEKQSVKLPFRLRSVSGNSIDRRTLAFVQYDERCYQKGGWDVPAITRPGGSMVGQVKYLNADYTKTPLPTQERIPVALSWQKPDNTIYGGADIHMFEDGRWRLIGTVNDVTEYRSDFSRGEVIKFKVVAFDQARSRARFSDAPTINVSLDVFEINLDPPTNLRADIYWRADATVRMLWDEPTTADAYYSYRVQHKLLTPEEYAAFIAVTDPEDYAEVITASTDYLTQPLAPDTQADIPNVELGRYVTRVRSEKGFNASQWVYLGVEVDAADIPVSITGLTLTGGSEGPEALDDEFMGPDANWTWDDIVTQGVTVTDPKTNLPAILQDYRVRILDDEGTVLRTEYVTTPSYSYTYSKNNDDTPDTALVKARRAFKIEVRIRGRQGQLGLPATMNVSNPPPARPSAIVAFAETSAMFVRWEECKEVDYAGTVVWMSDVDGFTPDDTTRVYSGKTNGARLPIEVAKQYYVRVGHYDSFDDNPVNITTQYGAYIPTIVIEQLEEAIQAGQDALAGVVAHEADIERISQAAFQLGLKTVNDHDYTRYLTHEEGVPIRTVVQSEIDARIEGDQAMIDKLEVIFTYTPDGSAAIINGESVLVSPTQSLAQKFTEIAVNTGEVQAALEEEVLARTTALDAEISARLTLAARVEDNEALFEEEVTARADGDSAIASTLAIFGAKTPDGLAFQVNSANFLVNGSQALSTVLDGIYSRFGTNEAGLANEITARADAVSAVASSVSTLSSTVAGHSSSITTQQSVINGISARYGLAVTAGNIITGFVANNDGVSGSFTIMANHFAIVDSAGGNTRVPFVYSGGLVRMSNVEVDTLAAGSVTAAKVLANNIEEVTKLIDNSVVAISPGGVLVCSGYVVTSGGLIDIDCMANITGSGGSIGHYFDVYCDSGFVGRFGNYSFGGWPYNNAFGSFRHQPGAGGHTYAVYAYQQSGGGSYSKDAASIKITDNKTQA